MRPTLIACALVALLPPSGTAHAQAADGTAVPVTVENFPRAESDLYFGAVVKRGGFGRFDHNREPTPIDRQDVIRMNRETLYSAAVLDLEAGPATIVMPDAGARFMSLMVIDQDHYVPAVFYGAGSHTLERERVGTRYALVAIRTLVDPGDPADIKAVHALQDAIQVRQANPGRFEVPNWDQASQNRVREALLVLQGTLPDFRNAFGARGEVDPIRHLTGSAGGWGGNPDKEAIYLNVAPDRNDGTTIYRLTVRDVPVDGFWSVSVYNAEGYFQQNPQEAYSVNNITGVTGPDGAIVIQFGGCDGRIPNCLPIMDGWNYMVRLYRPHAEILGGAWTFPAAELAP